MVSKGASSAAGGGAPGAVGIVSAARAAELAVEARRAEGAVRQARLEKKDAEGRVKELETRGKHLQVRTEAFGAFFGRWWASGCWGGGGWVLVGLGWVESAWVGVGVKKYLLLLFLLLFLH